ncbi:39S ribosomal protein L1, mitochondrial [Chelonus insularis]|uniref:39S ribosomal protein L1, mitochondrial n=1 Tax=Chelonus insularis TaxID=460826 RepID=UPI001589695A|nr:39S ribosomal protein L1, mitochondrial [Chelonus insularis]
MAATGAVKALNIISAAWYQKSVLGCFQSLPLLSQSRYYAARKGTREKAKKKKVKKEVQKVGFIPKKLRNKVEENLTFEMCRGDDLSKPERVDNVWIEAFHQPKIYSFEEAIEYHRQSHHSSMYNSPNAFVHAFLQLNMMGPKPTKMVEKFARTVDIPHPFDHGEKRTIVAFCNDPKLAELADKAGASISGGLQLIKNIQTGVIPIADYDYAVAHPDIMTELSVIKGLMKRKYPSPRGGTLGFDLPQLIKKILHGIKYEIRPHERQLQYGTGTILFGRLNMDVKQLEENFVAVIKDVEKSRPKRDGDFIFRASIESYPTTELLSVNFSKYLVEEASEVDSDNEEENVAVN